MLTIWKPSSSEKNNKTVSMRFLLLVFLLCY